MLGFIERSTIKLLSKRGNTPTQISHALGRDPKRVKRVLAEPTEKPFQRKKRSSLVDAYQADIVKWIDDQIPVTVMLDLARNKEAYPYSGGKSIFYQRVREIRQQIKAETQQAVWRFESLPGEYLQVDWGEKRNFDFTAVPKETRYVFVCRLKYSRFIFAAFDDNMRFETLVRCLLRGFDAIGGVPWVVLFDNMRTVTSGRNEDGSPIWVPRFRQFASEIGFHPEVCDRYAPNQKGSVENGVKFVKGNFLSGRTFRNDEDLAGQLGQWLVEKNHNKSQAHGQIPAELLKEELSAFDLLREKPDSYGLLYLLRVSPESVIRFQTNCYSVPEDFIGQTVTVRVAEKALRIYHDGELIAQHEHPSLGGGHGTIACQT